MLYTFNNADAPKRHDLQYFEMFGNLDLPQGLERGDQAQDAMGDGRG